MAAHSVNITLANSVMGYQPSTDGVMGLVCEGTTVSTTFVLGTPYLLTKLADLTTLGITSSNNFEIFKHVTSFYDECGDGNVLWLLGVATSTAYVTWLATSAFKDFIIHSGVSDPANQIKVVSIAYQRPADQNTTADFPADVTNSIPILQAQIKALRVLGYYICGVIDGYNMNHSLSSLTSLASLTTLNAPQVSVCISASNSTGISCVGMLLGRLARISVGSSIGRISDGPLKPPTIGGFAPVMQLTQMGDPAVLPLSKMTQDDFTTLGNKGFVFIRTWQGQSGYYWNDGATCDLLTASLNSLEFNRIANKLSADALSFFTAEIGKNIPVNKNGDADSTYCNAKSNDFFNTYINPLILSGDITDGKLTVTGADFIDLRTINGTLNIIPAPTIGSVAATIQFVKTL